MKRIFLILCCLLSFVSLAYAEVPSKPHNDIYVVDSANMFTSETTNKMLDLGKDLDKKYNAQVVVVTINNLDGNSIEETANNLFRDWGIGDKEKNNGVLILLSKEDRKIRIEVGYGLEEVLTDGYCKYQIDNIKTPLQNEIYDDAVLTIYTNIVDDIDHFYDTGEKPGGMNKFMLFVLFIFVLIILIVITSGGSGGGCGFSSGGFSSGSSSGGSSFGGGSSGGGGASGSW